MESKDLQEVLDEPNNLNESVSMRKKVKKKKKRRVGNVDITIDEGELERPELNPIEPIQEVNEVNEKGFELEADSDKGAEVLKFDQNDQWKLEDPDFGDYTEDFHTE